MRPILYDVRSVQAIMSRHPAPQSIRKAAGRPFVSHRPPADQIIVAIAIGAIVALVLL